MAIVQSAICNKMGEDADKILDKLDTMKGVIQQGIKDFRKILETMSWSIPTDVLTAAENVLANAGSLIPDISEWQDVMDTLLSCAFLKDAYSSPTAVVKSISDKITGASAEGIEALAGSLPEFSAAKAFDSVTSGVQTAKVDVDVTSVQGALACLASICGVDITSRTTRLNDFLSSCSLTSSGNPDLSKIMSDAGITDPSKIANMNVATSTFNNVQGQVKNSISQGTNVVKFLSKDNPLF